jgi:hypothetical protein
MPNSAWLLTQPIMTSKSFVRRVERRNAGRRASGETYFRARGRQELGVGCYRTVARPQSA